MHTLFVACLLGGVLGTALMLTLGRVGGAGHGHVSGGHGHGAPAHTTHLGHGHHGHTSSAHGHARAAESPFASSAAWAFSWLSPLGLAAAALWFGGAGLLAERFVPAVAVLVAVLAALVGAGIVRAVGNAFARASTPSLSLTGEGAIAVVNAAIKPGASGEVLYTLEGLRRSSPAKSVDGMAIPRGAEVVIVRREAGIAWVSPLLSGSADSSQSQVNAGDEAPRTSR